MILSSSDGQRPERRGVAGGRRSAGEAGARAERLFAGEVMDLGANRPFLLDGRQAFLVVRGEVHLFSVAHQRETPSARRHLLRVPAGGLLLGPGLGARPASRALLAVAGNGTQIELGTHQHLQELLRRPGTGPLAIALIEGWIQALSSGLGGPATPVGDPGAELRWIRPLAGEVLLAGQAELSLTPDLFTPVAAGLGLTVSEGAQLDLRRTEELEDPLALWQGLGELARLVLHQSANHLARETEADGRRAQARALASQDTMAEACERLAGAMRPAVFAEESTDDQPDLAGNALGPIGITLAACRMVAREAGIDLQVPAELETASVTVADPLGSVLRASRVRSRRVALRERWWRQDQGPMVGWLAGQEAQGPVALFWRTDRYWVCRPWVARSATPASSQPPRFQQLDADSAALLVPFAFTLYRSFPDAALGIPALMRFGFRGCSRDLLMVLIMGLASALLGLVPSVATGMLFNEIIPGAQRSQVWQIAVLLATAAVGSAAFGIVRGIALLRVRTRTGSALQAAVWDRLLRVPLRFFRRFTAGDLAMRASAIDAIQQILSGAMLTAFLGGLFSLMNVVLMFHYGPTMAWRGLLLLGVAVLVNLLGGLLQLKPQRGLVQLQSQTSGLVLQLLSSIGKLRAAGGEVRAFARWVGLFVKQRRLQFILQFIGNWLAAFQSAFPLLASVVMYWTVVPMLSSGQALPRTGDFLAFLAAFAACLHGLLGACSALLGAVAALPLYQQARPILEARPEVSVGRAIPGPLSGEIEVQHASFRYHPDAPLALRDVSFQIAPGEFVAFVGASGSGKSTLLKLLLGFETLESGSIHYDGQEIGALDIQEVRRQMGVVLQNGQLMAGDIHTNIAGAGTATQEQAWEAARLAGLAEDIASMPMGMHTVINDGAGTLSGGQRQRLMIARAIVHRPKLVLFDEATSALDNRSQAVVSASLEQLQATRVVVAHRLSTIVNADRIYVLDRGRIVQRGTYAELMADPVGPFAELARRQLT